MHLAFPSPVPRIPSEVPQAACHLSFKIKRLQSWAPDAAELLRCPRPRAVAGCSLQLVVSHLLVPRVVSTYPTHPTGPAGRVGEPILYMTQGEALVTSCTNNASFRGSGKYQGNLSLHTGTPHPPLTVPLLPTSASKSSGFEQI